MKKFSVKNYGLPTPDKWRRLGDSLLVTGTFGMTFASISNHRYLAIGIIVITIAGKFLTNFFAKENDSGQKSNRKKIKDHENIS